MNRITENDAPNEVVEVSAGVETSQASKPEPSPSFSIGWPDLEGGTRRDKFNRQKGTVVTFGRNHVTAISVDTRVDPVPVEILGRIAYEPEEVGESVEEQALRSFERLITEIAPGLRSITVVLGTPPLSRRLLHLPKASIRQTKALVRAAAQADGADAFSFHCRSDSFEGGQPGRGVEASWVSGGFLDAIETTAMQAGCAVKEIAGRPAASVTLARIFGVQTALPERFLAVEFGEELLRITLVDKGAVAFLRAVDLDVGSRHDVPSRIVTEIQRTSIFMKTRLRQSPAERVLVLGDDAAAINGIGERLQSQFGVQVHQVLTRFDARPGLEAKTRSWTYDAVAIVGAKDIVRAGALRMVAPKRQNRRRAFMWVPAGIIVGALVVAMSWWSLHEARSHERNVGIEHDEALRALERAPSLSGQLSMAVSIRARFRHITDELSQAVGHRAPTRAVLVDLTERLPPSVLVTRTVLASTGTANDGREAVGEGSQRRFLTIEGRVFDAAVNCSAIMSEATQALRESPFVASVRDSSGQYDPFSQSGVDLMSRQYPVLLTIELKETR